MLLWGLEEETPREKGQDLELVVHEFWLLGHVVRRERKRKGRSPRQMDGQRAPLCSRRDVTHLLGQLDLQLVDMRVPQDTGESRQA